MISPIQAPYWNACLVRYFRKRLDYSIVQDADCAALIVLLLFRRGPFAVFRRVRSIIVDAFDAVTWSRSHPYISYEVIERFPSSAYAYTATAIVFEVFIQWVLAAVSHALPRSVFGTIRKSMTGFPFGNPLAMLASAAARLAAPQVYRMNMFDRAAYAATLSQCHPILPVTIANGRPISELLSNESADAPHSPYHQEWINVQYNANNMRKGGAV